MELVHFGVNIMESLSILMSVKNGANFLSNSIRDIESNISPSDEILIIDDGSTDDTANILNSWAGRNMQVRIFKNSGIGLVDALNIGILESRNNWIARFDVDDRYSFQRISRQREAINDFVSLIFCDYELYTSKGKSLGVIPTAVDKVSSAISLISSQRTPHPAAVMRKESVLEVGGYRKGDFPAEDISLWLRMARVGHIVTVPEVLLNYRISKNSVSALNRKVAQKLTDKHLKEIGISKEIVSEGLNNWKTIFDNYSKLKFGNERQILFYRDLRHCIEFFDQSRIDKNELSRIRNYLLTDIANIKPILGLMQGKIKRNLYRKL